MMYDELHLRMMLCVVEFLTTVKTCMRLSNPTPRLAIRSSERAYLVLYTRLFSTSVAMNDSRLHNE